MKRPTDEKMLALYLEVLRKCLGNLEESIGKLNATTMAAPRVPQWDSVRDQVSCLDSTADVIRQVLDAMEER